MVSYVSRLNHICGLQLNHHDINFMYSLCRNIRSNYYLKNKDMRVRLISCLPDSNRNSAGEFVRVNGNWFANKLPCPFSLRNVGRYREPLFALSLHLLISCSCIELINLFLLICCKIKKVPTRSPSCTRTRS